MNVTEAPIYVHPILKALDGRASVVASRTRADLNHPVFNEHVAAGRITVSFISEAGDSPGGVEVMANYNNRTRPSADSVPPFTSIWNTDDAAPNWSDGVNWRDALGTIT